MTDDLTAVSHLTEEERLHIERAVERGIAFYIESRKKKIPAFVDRHFSLKGAFALQRKTLSKDFYKIPINMFWGLPVFLAQSGSMVAEKLGAQKLSRLCGKLPAGLKTEAQKEINWLIQTELLELPFTDGTRTTTRDALLESILNDPELSEQCAHFLATIDRKSQTPDFRSTLEKHLSEYGKSKLAVSELASNVMNLAAGYAAMQKATPGLLSAGSALASVVAQQVAIAHFWLGSTLGAWYYGIFPASASLGLTAAATGALMAATGILAALSMVLVDPLLAKTGFHRRRLERFIDALNHELTGKDRIHYRVKDHYLARVLDLVDLLKLGARAAGGV